LLMRVKRESLADFFPGVCFAPAIIVMINLILNVELL
jgi:hypothetical protein